jgi:hypothetical protein
MRKLHEIGRGVQHISAADQRILLGGSLRLLLLRFSYGLPIRKSDIARLMRVAESDEVSATHGVAA